MWTQPGMGTNVPFLLYPYNPLTFGAFLPGIPKQIDVIKSFDNRNWIPVFIFFFFVYYLVVPLLANSKVIKKQWLQVSLFIRFTYYVTAFLFTFNYSFVYLALNLNLQLKYRCCNAFSKVIIVLLSMTKMIIQFSGKLHKSFEIQTIS